MSQALASDVVMVLSAGLGTRMRPLTDDRPKPMVAVSGKALLDHCLDRVAEAGIARAVVNVHYLADQIEAHLATRGAPPQVAVSDERAELLETGGGMVRALPLIRSDPFFAINSDNVWLDGPTDVFRHLSAFWRPEAMDALLLMVPHQRATNYRGKGDFHLDPHGKISRRRTGRIAPFVYTGIQLVSHSLMRDAPQGPFSTGVLWNRAIDEGRLFGVIHQGQWCEVGSPEAIPPTEELLARG